MQASEKLSQTASNLWPNLNLPVIPPPLYLDTLRESGGNQTGIKLATVRRGRSVESQTGHTILADISIVT